MIDRERLLPVVERTWLRTFVLALVAVQTSVVLVNLSPLIDRYAVGELLDVNTEGTLVVWLSSTLLIGIAGLAAFAGMAERERAAMPRIWIGWLVVAGLFVLLSADETASIHELVGELVSRVLDVSFLPSLYTWVLVVAPLGLVIVVWMIHWFASVVGLRTPTGRLLMIAFGMWLMVPLLEAVDPSLGGPRWLVVIEETLETVGETLMLAALVGYMRLRDWYGRGARPQPDGSDQRSSTLGRDRSISSRPST